MKDIAGQNDRTWADWFPVAFARGPPLVTDQEFILDCQRVGSSNARSDIDPTAQLHTDRFKTLAVDIVEVDKSELCYVSNYRS
jgi:hypothetical protein